MYSVSKISSDLQSTLNQKEITFNLLICALMKETVPICMRSCLHTGVLKVFVYIQVFVYIHLWIYVDACRVNIYLCLCACVSVHTASVHVRVIIPARVCV